MALRITSFGLLAAGLALGEMTHGLPARVVAPALLLLSVTAAMRSIQRRDTRGARNR
jgi:hypothetical protein